MSKRSQVNQEHLLVELELLHLEIARLKRDYALLESRINGGANVPIGPGDTLASQVYIALKANAWKATAEQILKFIDSSTPDAIPIDIVDRLSYLERRIKQIMDSKLYLIIQQGKFYMLPNSSD